MKNAISIVEKYGQLSIDGINLVDKNGNAVELRGMSLFLESMGWQLLQ